jgi:hypothetical protein
VEKRNACRMRQILEMEADSHEEEKNHLYDRVYEDAWEGEHDFVLN